MAEPLRSLILCPMGREYFAKPGATRAATITPTAELLVEPSLYLRMDEGAPERFARALHDRVLFENEMLKV
jgi:hypothetical protein